MLAANQGEGKTSFEVYCSIFGGISAGILSDNLIKLMQWLLSFLPLLVFSGMQFSEELSGRMYVTIIRSKSIRRWWNSWGRFALLTAVIFSAAVCLAGFLAGIVLGEATRVELELGKFLLVFCISDQRLVERIGLEGEWLLPPVEAMEKTNPKWRIVLYPVLAVLGIYMILYLYCGEILTHSPYNSYTKQCISWLNGRLDLGQNYQWLELAIDNGKYYVSFPPFPSYVFLPFALIFGENTPESLINLLAALIGVAYCAMTALEYKWNEWYAILLPIFLYTGGAVFPLPLSVGVWFVAQNMSFTLTVMSIYYAKRGLKGVSLFLLCCASGCRPFQIVYLPLIIYIYTRHSQSGAVSLKEYLLKRTVVFTPTVLLAASYLLLNFLRFGNPLEFGHNYLPEFTNSENGQFHFSYILQNLYKLIRLPEFSPEAKMSIPQFNGMNIFICFPILVWWLYVSVKSKAAARINLLVLCCFIAHILLLVSHKTMGGYHYGNRYIADTLPAVFAAVCASRFKLKRCDFLTLQAVLLFGMVFNVIGYSQFLQAV